MGCRGRGDAQLEEVRVPLEVLGGVQEWGGAQLEEVGDPCGSPGWSAGVRGAQRKGMEGSPWRSWVGAGAARGDA